jgi:DNA polymerase III subunit delta
MSNLTELKKIITELRSGVFRPVYLLHGEESFFIDLISEEVEALALQEHERDFNQNIMYGRDANADIVKDTCLRYPMMAERQLVIVRELQSWRIEEVEKLEPYLLKPTPTTVLVLCYKHKKVDGRKTILKSAQKGGGFVFLSDKVKEEKLPELLITIAKKQKRRLGNSEAQLLSAHLGSDLAKAVKEVEKLCLVTEEGGSITSDAIQRFVGISKDHNIFELQNAIGTRNTERAMRIAQYFASAPKDHPLPMTLGFLNGYLTKLAIVHNMAGRNSGELASAMKVAPFFVKDYQSHAGNYSLGKVVEMQRHLRQCDLRSKGLGGDGSDHGELLRELLAKMMS